MKQINNNWKSTLVGNILTLKYGKGLPKRQRIEGEYPVIGSGGVVGYHHEPLVKGPGIIVGRKGSIGTVHFEKRDFFPIDTVFYVEPKSSTCDIRFIYYLLLQSNFSTLNSDAAVPGLNRDTAHLQPCRVPPPPTQRIRILEEMAQALYREWFVKFRFPGHENVEMVESELGLVPEGWGVKNLFDIADVTYGFPFKSKLFTAEPVGKAVIRIRDLKTNGTKTYTTQETLQKYIVKDGDLLVGMDGDFHMCKWAGGEACLNQRVVRFRPKHTLPAYCLFLALEKPIHYFDSTIVGTTVAHLGDKNLKSIQLVIPPPHTLCFVQDIFDALFNLEINLRIKNTTLRRTRDLLLPKLISCEVDVSNLEIETEALAT